MEDERSASPCLHCMNRDRMATIMCGSALVDLLLHLCKTWKCKLCNLLSIYNEIKPNLALPSSLTAVLVLVPVFAVVLGLDPRGRRGPRS